MPDTDRNVTFYAIESDFPSIAIKLIEKKYTQGERVLLLCSHEDELQLLDSNIWTYSKLSFIPHGSARSIGNDDIEFCYTWLSTEIVLSNNPKCLIHNGLTIKDDKIQKFQNIIDIFDKSLIDESKIRASYYEDMHFNCQKTWIQQGSKWIQGENT
ncbi:MAG: DNA polymerase III subunit chi [Holosporales bacterium]|jgi:DNA polymerase IIIc chi subunit|nr:DNA polymerase III subunit chi [Holosporales bacterium]